MRTTTPSSIQSEEALTFATKSVSVALEETTKETDTLPRTAVGSEKGGESNLRSGEPFTHEWGVGGGEGVEKRRMHASVRIAVLTVFAASSFLFPSSLPAPLHLLALPSLLSCLLLAHLLSSWRGCDGVMCAGNLRTSGRVDAASLV